MVIITYPIANESVHNWKNQLENLVTSHKFIEDTSIDVPILKHNSEIVTGTVDIDKYIDSLSEFKRAWFC